LIISEIGALIFTSTALDQGPTFYVFWLAGMAGMHHSAQLLLIEMASHKLFSQAGLKL
jgi:hypothetical protein